MSKFQYLEDLFVKFQRLNQILGDNWHDSTQEGFKANHLTPIVTEWSLYHSSMIDLSTRLKSLENDVDEAIISLRRDIENSVNNVSTGLEGTHVYGVRCEKGYLSMCRYFLLSQSDAYDMDEDELMDTAYSKFPSMDEIKKVYFECML